MVLFRLGQNRNFPTAATPLAVPLAVTATALPESLPATLTLWATTSRANDGDARQPVRTTRANSFLIFPPYLAAEWRASIDCEALKMQNAPLSSVVFHSLEKSMAEAKLSGALGLSVRNLFCGT